MAFSSVRPLLRIMLSATRGFIISGILPLAALAQGQHTNTAFVPSVAHPSYSGQHPLVLFDEGHENRHGIATGYRAFANLLENDGYKVSAITTPFDADNLRAANVLVIVNPMGPRGNRAAPAFTEAESAVVESWVRTGGSLLLVVDHYPIGDAAQILATRFGVDVGKGVVEDTVQFDRTTSEPDPSRLVFARANHLLGDHPITNGRNHGERINRVVTFTGASVSRPRSATALLELSPTAIDERAHVRVDTVGSDVRVHVGYGDAVAATGRAQGIAFPLGHGRVVVLGEAAMITAQENSDGSIFGMNVPGTDNKQFTLNVLHWLSGLLPQATRK